MTHYNINTFFDNLPIDLQDKICENIFYKLPTILIDDIKTIRFAKYFYDIQKNFILNPKKLNGLSDTLHLMRKHGAYKQADTLYIIIQDILKKQELENY